MVLNVRSTNFARVPPRVMSKHWWKKYWNQAHSLVRDVANRQDKKKQIWKRYLCRSTCISLICVLCFELKVDQDDVTNDENNNRQMKLDSFSNMYLPGVLLACIYRTKSKNKHSVIMNQTRHFYLKTAVIWYKGSVTTLMHLDGYNHLKDDINWHYLLQVSSVSLTETLIPCQSNKKREHVAPREYKPPPRLIWGSWNSVVRHAFCVKSEISWKIRESPLTLPNVVNKHESRQ